MSAPYRIEELRQEAIDLLVSGTAPSLINLVMKLIRMIEHQQRLLSTLIPDRSDDI